MQMFNYIFTILFLFSTLTFADVSGTSIKGATPNTYLIEGFNEVASAAGTTTLTKDSQTKQILTGTTTQTYVLPSATTIPLSRKFLFINKSTGLMTIQTSGGGALTTVSAGSQKEVHLRSAGSAAGTWDVLNTGGVWGSISGTLGAQTDLQAALDAKPDESTLTTKGDIYAATGSGVVTRLGVSGNNGYVLTEDSAEPTGFKWAASSGGGGGVWGGITGVLSNQTDLQAALDLKAPLASPTFSGTITTPLTASRALVTGASSELAASAVTATQLGYLGTTTSDVQTQLDAKQARSTLTTAGDIYVATASATTTRLGPPAIDGRQLVSDSSATNKIRYAAPLVDNFIKNGDAESVTPITTYADAAGTRPVDGTGGSPNVTTSISSSSPMFDSNSFTLVKDAVNRQGQGWAIPFTIPAGQQAKVLQIEIPYIVSSGTFVAGTSSADSDVIVYLYDVTNSALIEPSSIKLLSNSSTISDKFIANFQTSATGTSYRLIMHVASTSASAYTLKIDDVQVKPSSYVYGTPISDWSTWTPTIVGGGGTISSTLSGKRRRVGDSEQYNIQYSYASGTGSGASNFFIGLPSGISRDTNKMVPDQLVGTGFYYSTAGGFKNANVRVDATGFYFTKDSGAFLLGTDVDEAGSAITVNITMPVTGWSSSIQMSDGYDARLVAARYTNAAGTSIPTSIGTAPWATKDYDTTGSFSSDIFTAPSSGIYEVNLSMSTQSQAWAANSYFYAGLAKNGTSVTQTIAQVNVNSAITAGVTLAGTAQVLLVAGDTLRIRYVSSDSGHNLTASSVDNWVTFKKLQAPTTISATEKVVATYKTLSSTTITSGTALKFTTSVEDSHARYNTSTGAYLIESQGTYEFVISGINAGAATDVKMFIGATDMGVIGSLASGSGRQSIAIQHPFNAGDSITFVPQTSSSATDTVGWLMVKKIK